MMTPILIPVHLLSCIRMMMALLLFGESIKRMHGFVNIKCEPFREWPPGRALSPPTLWTDVQDFR